jgi:4-hydroxy-tetrahydrodipicolinate reductase
MQVGVATHGDDRGPRIACATPPIGVVVLGTGRMGGGIAELVLEKRGLALDGVYARRERRAETDIGLLLGLGHDVGITVGHDLQAMLDRTRPQVAIQATCSRVAEAFDEIRTLLRHDVNVISIAEEMAFPARAASGLAAELNALAMAHRVTVLGTGVNPGFVLDLLVIALTGVCRRVDAIHARRSNDLAPYGATVLREQGVGLTPEAFARRADDGTITGHIGFPESIAMIGRALGWRLDRVEQTREPIISRVRRESPIVTVEPGCAAGCLHTATAYRDGRPVITLEHPQQIHPHLENVRTEDSIEILGEPHVRVAGSPEIPGGVATCAIAVNMIPPVLNAAPGLVTMADLPVPAALMGDARRLVHRDVRERSS